LRSLDETDDIRRTTPIGAGWVEYRMPLDFGWVAEQALQRDMRRPVIPPIVMRFALHPEDGAPPSITNAVIVAEKVRQAVLKRHSDMNGTPASKRLAGKQHDGRDRREGHDHPFFLPLDRANRGVVDAVDIWLPAGCTQDEFLALSGIARLWDPAILQGAFAITYVGQVEREAGNVWRTATPVILDRFPKRRGPGGSVVVDAPEEQLRRALAMRGFFPTSIKVWNVRETTLSQSGGGMRLDAFRRGRIGEPTRRPAVGATLRFDQPATGPIVLGRLAHFGLGRFEPVLGTV
jgi:CRISPR-associated protein Csb2